MNWRTVLAILWGAWGIFIGAMFVGCALTPTPHQVSDTGDQGTGVWMPGLDREPSVWTPAERSYLEHVDSTMLVANQAADSVAQGEVSDLGYLLGEIDMWGIPALAPSDRFEGLNGYWSAALDHFKRGADMIIDGDTVAGGREIEAGYEAVKTMDGELEMFRSP